MEPHPKDRIKNVSKAKPAMSMRETSVSPGVIPDFLVRFFLFFVSRISPRSTLNFWFFDILFLGSFITLESHPTSDKWISLEAARMWVYLTHSS
jgi:hypothetical protein